MLSFLAIKNLQKSGRQIFEDFYYDYPHVADGCNHSPPFPKEG
jgi:hypothetical protein